MPQTDAAPTRPRRRRLLKLLVAIASLAVLPPVVANAWVLLGTRTLCHAPAGAPPRKVAIVLGASVYRGGRPSRILKDRLDAAADLYARGVVRSVLVSGDRDLDRDYDEIGPMRQYLLDRGVPPTVIETDPHGYRTFDSMWRARHVFDIDSALVVTNSFHLARSVWLGRRQGIDCAGVAAPEQADYSWRTRGWNALREAAARTMAVADALLFDTRPRVSDQGEAVVR